jgi:hypothetical protein
MKKRSRLGFRIPGAIQPGEIDTTPNQFTFTDAFNEPVAQTVTSAPVTISGLATGVSVTANATGGTIDVNGDGNFQATRTVTNGSQIRARRLSANNPTSTVGVTVNISGVIDTFDITTAAAVGVPGQPGVPSGSALSASSIFVSWAPSSGSVTGYRLYRRLSVGPGAWGAPTTITGNSATVSGLSPSTGYQFYVQAFNGSGDSAVSATSSAITTPATSADPFQYGMNVSLGASYAPVRNFANMFFDADANWVNLATGRSYSVIGDNADAAHGWPKQVPAGQTIRRAIRYGWEPTDPSRPGSTYLKAGNYKIVVPTGWTPNLETVSIERNGFTNLVVAGNVLTFSIPDAFASHTVWLQLTQNTGSAFANLPPGPTSIQVYEVRDEALLATNPYAIYPEALNIYAGFRLLRFADAGTVNGVYCWREPTDCPPKTHFMGGYWPMEIIAEFTRQVSARTTGGTGAHVQLPSFVDRANPSTDATTDQIAWFPWPQINNTFGKQRAAISQGVTSTTITLDAGANSSDDHYNGLVVALFGSGIYATITDYVGATRVATIDSWVGGTPTGTPRYITDPTDVPANGTDMGFMHYEASSGYLALGLPDAGPWRVINRTRYFCQLANPATPTTPMPLNTVDRGEPVVTQLRNYETGWNTLLTRLHTEWPDMPRIVVAPFLETWNGQYLHQSIENSWGAYLHNGTRTIQDYTLGHVEFTLIAWKLAVALYGKPKVPYIIESGVSPGNSRVVDVPDRNGHISLNTPMHSILEQISIATYYSMVQVAIPPYGTIDFRNDPTMTTDEIFRRLGNGTMNEPSPLVSQATVEALMAANGDNIPPSVFLLHTRSSLHLTSLLLRVWMNKLSESGKTLGVHYRFHAYEDGNHQRNDRTAPGTMFDTVMRFQDQFIAWNFGNDPTIQAFRADRVAFLNSFNFTTVMQFHAIGNWTARGAFQGQVATQVQQFSILPFAGAEDLYPNLRHSYDHLKQYDAGAI